MKGDSMIIVDECSIFAEIGACEAAMAVPIESDAGKHTRIQACAIMLLMEFMS